MPTRTILHPQLEGDAITDFHAIPTSICSRTQAKKAISRQPICLSDFSYDSILEEIDQQEKIDFEREIDGAQPSVFSHISLNDVVNTCLFLSNDINRLLCAVVVAASVDVQGSPSR